MITLTKEQKIEAYKWVLTQIDPHEEGSFSRYVCPNLSMWLKLNTTADKPWLPMEYFPEFLVHKPEHRVTNMLWWYDDENNLRIQAVKDTIKSLQNS